MRRHLIVLGDSVVAASDQPEHGRWTTHTQTVLDQHQPGGWSVWNRGIGGETSQQGLDRLQRDVIPLLPGIVVIAFGINDAYVLPWSRTPRIGLAQFAANISELGQRIAELGGIPWLVVPHLLHLRPDQHTQGDGSDLNRRLEEYRSVLRRLGSSHGWHTLDLLQGLTQCGEPPATLLADDGLHLSTVGNHHYGDVIAAAVRSA
jgi:acyl-CoA thioesterase I